MSPEIFDSGESFETTKPRQLFEIFFRIVSRAGRRRFHCRTSSLEVLPHKAAVKIKNKISPTHFHQLWSKWSRWAALNELISYQNHNHCCYSSWLTRPSSLLVCVAAGVWIASDYFRCFMCHRRLLCDF